MQTARPPLQAHFPHHAGDDLRPPLIDDSDRHISTVLLLFLSADVASSSSSHLHFDHARARAEQISRWAAKCPCFMRSFSPKGGRKEGRKERNRSFPFFASLFHIPFKTVTGGATYVRSDGWMASRAVFSHLNGLGSPTRRSRASRSTPLSFPARGSSIVTAD